MIKIPEPITTGIAFYIDAGTGSLIFQLLIAGALAGSFFLKTHWRKVKTFLKNLLSRVKKSGN